MSRRKIEWLLLTGIAQKYSFNHIGIECANDKSGSFAQKLGFYTIDGENYAIIVANLIYHFFNGIN